MAEVIVTRADRARQRQRAGARYAHRADLDVRGRPGRPLRGPPNVEQALEQWGCGS